MLSPPRRAPTVSVPTRRVRCYHCFQPIVVAQAARSHSCPRCSRRLELDDFVLGDQTYTGPLMTCGRLVIGPRARALPRQAVHAAEGADIAGDARGEFHCGGAVRLHGQGAFEGRLRASSLEVREGATFHGHVEIRPAVPAIPRSPHVVERPAGVLPEDPEKSFRPSPLVRALAAMRAGIGARASASLA